MRSMAATPKLNFKETVDFIKRVKKDLKRPVKLIKKLYDSLPYKNKKIIKILVYKEQECMFEMTLGACSTKVNKLERG